ncbi:hypothetical protein SCB71_06465 [Herbiconiux sp. KACC 21604]|uniref:hypothetical protein n=1 Tax=unclassified Herbiconiux TaxID=2618217 RepID=UPI001492D973|nr:hypothetical protein [Herbiconiux sp. SALV-R1]QJU52958.1 hypothetical protein HL652_04450 [Herbiconiux sp. SALV-R1]WPO87882.1 hypothetical protein SCB71_06465 [Herbiconiux sp. KACC 21604]
MTVKYTSKKPDETKDGLQNLEDAWTRPEVEPEPVVVVGLVSRHAIAKNAGGDWQATAGLQHVEVLTGDGADEARELLALAYQARTGDSELEIPEAD